MNKSFIILPNQGLYRYDYQNPPKNWENEYHSIVSKNGKVKNKVSLFFFFENKDTAILTAKRGIEQAKFNEFWLTTTMLTEAVNLLDLRGGSTFAMLHTIFSVDTNHITLNLTFTGMQDDSSKFEKLEELHMALMNTNTLNEEYISKWLELHKPFIYPTYPYSLLGQRLTDYDNGEIFKSFLISKGYDGYIFDESYGGSTICLINSNKLSPPQKFLWDNSMVFEWMKSYYHRQI